MAEEQDLFVGIPEPKEVRKLLLEANKEVIVSLKQHEKYHSIRAEKIKKADELKSMLSHLTVLMRELKAKLPEVKVQKQVAVKGSSQKQRTAAVKMSSPELNRLERELDSVEAKLKNL